MYILRTTFDVGCFYRLDRFQLNIIHPILKWGMDIEIYQCFQMGCGGINLVYSFCLITPHFVGHDY
jgi:hypothetical protein